ncbi:hypothetical protein JCM8097_009269 [Rhodosporidiobolus ruineniae]
MALYLAEKIHLDRAGYDGSSGARSYGPTPFTVPGLPTTLYLGYNGVQHHYYLSWIEHEPRVVKSGTILATVGSKIVLEVDVPAGSFPPFPYGQTYNAYDNSLDFSQDVDVSVCLTVGAEQVDSPQVPERVKYAEFSSTLLTARTTSNVCLHFPRSNKRLWVSETFLKQSSPYFQQLLDSAFSEGTVTSPAQPSFTALDDYAFDESDEETDELDPAAKPKEEELETPYKTITVTDTAYSTYFAVLVWLQSRYILFGSLSSSFRQPGKTRGDTSGARAAANLAISADSNPALPRPVSPKSVYRLSHLLELPELSSLALANFNSQLTPSNAIYELYSDVSTCYADVKKVVLAYVVENWDKVKEEPATKEVEAKADAGELAPGVAGTSMLLARRLAEKNKA